MVLTLQRHQNWHMWVLHVLLTRPHLHQFVLTPLGKEVKARLFQVLVKHTLLQVHLRRSTAAKEVLL